MFQVNATRSRQKQSSVNRAAAAAGSFAASASPKSDSQASTDAVTSFGSVAVVIGQAPIVIEGSQAAGARRPAPTLVTSLARRRRDVQT